jgi:hypothetical protein
MDFTICMLSRQVTSQLTEHTVLSFLSQYHLHTNTGYLKFVIFFILSNTTTTKCIPQAEPKKLLLPPCP